MNKGSQFTLVIGVGDFGQIGLNYFEDNYGNHISYLLINDSLKSSYLENAEAIKISDVVRSRHNFSLSKLTHFSQSIKRKKALVIFDGGTNNGEIIVKSLINELYQKQFQVSFLISIPFYWEGFKRRNRSLRLIEVVKPLSKKFFIYDCNKLLNKVSEDIKMSEMFNSVISDCKNFR